jgi:hypothetical protein
MLRTLRILYVVVIALLVSSSALFAQDGIKPPKENLSRAELEKWLVSALTKHASYRTGSTSVSASGVRLVGCTMSFSLLRKSNPRPNDTVNAVLKTKGVKHEIEFDVSQIEPNGIELADYVLPEFRIIIIREKYGRNVEASGSVSRLIEIVVRHEAADAIKNALERMHQICVAGS